MHFSIGVVLCLVRVRLGKEMLEVELGSQPCSLVVSGRSCLGHWLCWGLAPLTV